MVLYGNPKQQAAAPHGVCQQIYRGAYLELLGKARNSGTL